MRNNLKGRKLQMLLHVGSVFVASTVVAIFFILGLGNVDNSEAEAVVEGFNMEIPEPENNVLENSKLKAIITEQNRLEEERCRRKMQNNSFDLLGNITKVENDIDNVAENKEEQNVRQKIKLAEIEDVKAPGLQAAKCGFARPMHDVPKREVQSKEERFEKLKKMKEEELKRKKTSILERYGVPAEQNETESRELVMGEKEQELLPKKTRTDRKNGFKSLGEKGERLEAGSIRAVVHGEQKDITSSSQVKLRILDPIEVAGSVIPQNTLIIGKASFSENRVFVTIENIAYKDNVYPFKGCIYDRDGFKGIYIPDNLVNDAGKEGGEGTVRGLQVNTGGLRGLLDKSANALVDATKSVVSGAIKETKVTLPANYKLIIKMMDK